MVDKKKYDQFSEANQASLLMSGRDYFSTLETLIDSAMQELHLQVYIFEPDETGLQIKKALIKAASRQVAVFVLVDSLGSSSLTNDWVDEMIQAGIHFRFFGPMFTSSRLNIGRRMHHKVTVADASKALVGGINIGNRYNHFKNELPWFDFAVKVEGEIALQLQAFCAKKWKGSPIRFREKTNSIGRDSGVKQTLGPLCMRVRVNDQLRRKVRIVYSYRNAIREAKTSIMIVGAYFIPGRTFIRLMKKAAARGVKIKIISGSRSDVWVARFGMNYLYRKLLRNGMEIYEYTPASVHGKALIADKKFVTIGSYDLNQLSTFINLELNLDIDNKEFAHHFQHILEKTIHTDCIQITPAVLKKRETIMNLFKQWLAYRLLRILFIFTLYTSNKEAQ